MPGHSTPSQTVGPFFSIGMGHLNRADLSEGTTGERITIQGTVIDGDGQPVPDAILEIWQADASGQYHHPEQHSVTPNDATSFFGFGRIPTDDHGRFSFITVRPGPVHGPDGKPQAPHLQISVFMRGLLKQLVTRLYFPEEPLNPSDPVLQVVPESRRETLIARQASQKQNTLEWNVCLQGGNETVFFDC
jgi:protocatechuate 3,4-dioxygenase, alpha subunit